MVDQWRLFIAIELPEDVLTALDMVQARLKQQAPPHTVRWVGTNGIHLTLKFLGDVIVSEHEALQHALALAAQGIPNFSLAAGELGCFPNVSRPRVIWVGVHGDLPMLMRLHDRVESQVAPLGYPTEKRAFSPHLTLGRVRQDASRRHVEEIGTLIARSSYAVRHPWPVNAVSLIRSELKPSGAVYTELFRAALQQPDNS